MCAVWCAQCSQVLLLREKHFLRAEAFAGSTAPAAIVHIPLEAGQSYWDKDEHPVTQTGVGLCHLLSFSSRALTAKKLHAPSTLL